MQFPFFAQTKKLFRQFVTRGLSVFVLLVCLSLPATSGTSDWTISITTKEIAKCLDYPDSKLQPLVRATIKFEQGLAPRSEEEQELAKAGYITEEEVALSLYEDIYYSRSTPVGLRRYNKLGIRPGTPGTIKITLSDSRLRQEEAHAAANATVRIFLDAYLKKSALRTIFVPRDNFDLFVEGLQRYGFRRVSMTPGEPVSALVVVSVRSEPRGRVEYLGYGM